MNDDLHTSRTFEIPACGGFMLSERSKEHSDFFEENKEAIFFDSAEELFNKINIFIIGVYFRETSVNLVQSPLLYLWNSFSLPFLFYKEKEKIDDTI